VKEFGTAMKISRTTNDMDDQQPFEHLTVWELISTDRQMTLWMMEEELKNNKEAIHKIVVEDIGKWKICTRFVPHCSMKRMFTLQACQEFIQSVEMITPFLTQM
jgi:hypothetical protein